MKIFYISDLHLDFYVKRADKSLIRFLNMYFGNEQGEVLLLPGDISHYVSQIKMALEYFATKFNHVLFTVGNHEFYNVSSKQEHTYKHLYDKFNEIKHLQTPAIFLDGSYVEINGVRIGGGCAWHDISYLRMKYPHCTEAFYRSLWKNYMNDGNRIPELDNPDKLTDIELDKIKKLPFLDILVTHYVPSNIDRLFPNTRNDDLNTFFCFDGSNLNFNISVHGHSHGQLDIELDKRYIRNAVGYPDERLGIKLRYFEI